MLRDTNERDTTTDLFGHKLVLFIIVYDNEFNILFLRRSWNSEFSVWIMTFDTWQLTWRCQDVKIEN